MTLLPIIPLGENLKIFYSELLYITIQNMKMGNIITLVGVSLLLFYSIVTILNFYGIGENVYGIYLLFYLFMIFSMIVLPNDYPTIL